MNFFSILWIKIVELFRSAEIKQLEPIPVETADNATVVNKLIEDIERVKVMSPRVTSEVLKVDVALFKAVNPKPVTPVEQKIMSNKKQLTKDFHIDEFACHDGTAVPAELYANVLELAQNLQALRDLIGKPITISSGYRHPAYNKSIGGARNSQHMEAKAADIKVKGMGPEKVAKAVEEAISSGKMKKGGVGRYPTFTHYDTRGKNARWGGTRKKV